MADSQLGRQKVMNNLMYVPKSEFDRALNLFKDPNVRCAVFAALCRINALNMIARAGSGLCGSPLADSTAPCQGSSDASREATAPR